MPRTTRVSRIATRCIDLRWLGVALSVIALTDSARATSISHLITGVVTQVEDPEATLDPSVAAGAPFAAFVSYEPPGVVEREGTSFPAPYAVISLEVGLLRVGSGLPSTGDLVICVFDGTYFGSRYHEPDEPGGDWIGFQIELPASNGPPVHFLSFDFVDPTGQALSDTSIPTGPLDLNLLAGSFRLGASGMGGPDFFVLGTVDSMLLVPEPSAFLLCAAGLVLLVLVRRTCVPRRAASPGSSRRN